MKTVCYFFLGCEALFFLSGCSQLYLGSPKPGPAEMYAWSPPSESELKLRRFRQKELDAVAADIEELFRLNEEANQPIEALRASLADFDKDLAEGESRLAGRIGGEGRKEQQLETELSHSKLSAKQAEIDIKNIQQARIDRLLSLENYSAAILLFKDGKFDRSAAQFKKSLGQNPPPSLRDRIHFGISSAYYKLRKYPEAAKDLDALVTQFPKSEKWFISGALLGWIYNTMGEKSKAIFVLDNVLKRNPPDNVRQIVEKLIQLIREEEPHAGS